MIIASYNNKRVHLPNKWSDLTISQAIEMCQVDLPEVEDTFDWFRHMDTVKRFVKIMTDIEEPDLIDPSSLVHFFSKYLLRFVIDLKLPAPETFMPSMIDSFTHEGETYLMPIHLDLGINVVLMHGEKMKPFIEASNLLKQFSLLRSEGIKALPMLVASLVKQERLEEWSEEVVVERAKSFERLPMDLAWEVFFLLIATHNQIRERYPAIYEQKGKQDGKADKELGYEGWTFAIAKSGIAGTIKDVNELALWDGLEILNYIAG